MAPFSAFAEPTAAAYADLAVDLAKGLEVRLFRPEKDAEPNGWETLSVRPIQQMIATATAQLSDLHLTDDVAVPLGSAEATEMVALAHAAKPGPFDRRTGELGRYVGVRDKSGRLIAMAGERFRLPGYVELSAICVHPDARGRGLGAALTLHLARAAFARGELPFLHVFPDNPAAKLYARLGFQTRATLWVIWRRPMAAESGT
jgi:predicted GNAT family acetyltransferase